jgi:hypothetical protein
MDPKRHYKASDMKGIPKYFQVRFSDLIMATITKQEFFFHKSCVVQVFMEIIIPALCLQLLQIGTVVEGGADFYSGRLTKKERKGTFADELLADTSLKAYRYGHFSSVFCNYLPAGKNHPV